MMPLDKARQKHYPARLNDFFGMNSRAEVAYFRRDTDLSPYDVVFDCVDNFETRIVLSEQCKDQGKMLISGGTSADAGQVVIYNPVKNGATPAELLGLYEIVAPEPLKLLSEKGHPARTSLIPPWS